MAAILVKLLTILNVFVKFGFDILVLLTIYNDHSALKINIRM